MIDPVNGSVPVSTKDTKATALPASKSENVKLLGSDTPDTTMPVKKTNETLENIDKKSKQSIENTIQALKDFVESNNRSLKIQVHQGTGDIMIKVISEKDGRVIREIPPEKVLDIVENMEEHSGILFNKNA
jgi:flagellar protein FlaG